MLMAGIHLIPIILSAGAASHHYGAINEYRLPALSLCVTDEKFCKGSDFL